MGFNKGRAVFTTLGRSGASMMPIKVQEGPAVGEGVDRGCSKVTTREG